MSVRLQWQGMNEFKEALRKLPQHLADEASGIVIAAAQNAAQDIRAGYPVRTTGLHPTKRRKSRWYPPGNLQKGVTVSQERGLVSTAAKVTSRAPHAWLYEKGTPGTIRKHKNAKSVGTMPAAPPERAFIPKVIRARARMIQALVALLEREGFLVSKDAA